MPPRILYLSHTASLSGAEMSLLSLISSLDRARFEPLAVLPGEGPFLDRLAGAGLAVHVLPLVLPTLRRPRTILRNANLLRSFAREKGIRLLHANSFHAIKQAVPLRRLGGSPLVGHLRDILPFTRLTRAAIHGCDRVICVSEATAANLAGGASAGPDRRVRVIPNGIDPEIFSGLPPREEALARIGIGPLPGPAVGMAAPLVRWKGQHLLLEAASAVLADLPDATFILAGGESFAEPGYVDGLRRAASEAPLAGRVRFAGFVEDLRDLYAAMDVVVCPSIEPDPLPRAVLEAMAAARPVVGAALGGLPEMVVDGVTGLLVPPRDPARLASAIVGLLRDPALRGRMGRAGAERVSSRFSLRAHAERVMDLYEELLTRRD